MAACVEARLAGIKRVLGCLSHSQEEVKAALEHLSEILLQCAKAGDTDTRNSCFRLGLVKATLGVLRSSSDVSTLATAARCVALLTHANEEARLRLGAMGAVRVLLKLLDLRPHTPEDHVDVGGAGEGAGRPRPLWPKEWVPVYEQALVCLTKLTYHNASNQQELARLGGIKLILDLSMDANLCTNYSSFPLETKSHLEELVLRGKFISRVTSVPPDDRASVLRSFPALTQHGKASASLHYPAFHVDLVTSDGEWVARVLSEKGVVWPECHTPIPEGSKWTCVVCTGVEEDCGLWCQFCVEKPSQAISAMNRSLEELVREACGMLHACENTVACMYM